MSKRPLSIDGNKYPGDRNIRDLIIAKKLSASTLRKFLRERGIISFSQDTRKLTDLIGNLVLSHEELINLTRHAQITENRPRVVVNQVSNVRLNLEQIHDLLANDFKLADDEPTTRLANNKLSPKIDTEQNSVSVTHSFKKIDYQKTALLQEADHTFSVSFINKGNDSYDIVYSTTASESVKYFQQIRSAFETKTNRTAYIHAIELNELNPDQWNEFFDRFIQFAENKYKVVKIETAKLRHSSAIDQPETEEVEEEDEEQEGESDGQDDNQPFIRQVHIDGSSVLSHPEVVRYRTKDYFLASVTAFLSGFSPYFNSREIKFRAGFNKNGKFETEIIQAWVMEVDKDGKAYRDAALPLSKQEREDLLRQVNSWAFKLYDVLINKPETNK